MITCMSHDRYRPWFLEVLSIRQLLILKRKHREV